MPWEDDSGMFFLSGNCIYLNNLIGEEPRFGSSSFTEMYQENHSAALFLEAASFKVLLESPIAEPLL